MPPCSLIHVAVNVYDNLTSDEVMQPVIILLTPHHVCELSSNLSRLQFMYYNEL